MKKNELRIFVILLVLVCASAEGFLVHNVLYTGGEIIQAGYLLMVFLNVPILLIALWKPRIGMWLSITLAALLLPGQAYENRKWALIHEEVFVIRRHLASKVSDTNIYPKTLDDHKFKNPSIKEHIIYTPTENGYRLTYFMDDMDITYWYDSEKGFGYYPD